MKKSVVLIAVLSLAALGFGAVMVMNSSLVTRASASNADHAGHDHGHGGHQHGPNGECPLDEATAVGVDEAKPAPSVKQADDVQAKSGA